MARSIQLTRDEQSRKPDALSGDAFRLRITAHDAVDMPVRIFLHENRLINVDTGDTIPDFLTVVSPFDLTLYPEDTPSGSQVPAFFRLAVADFLLPSQAYADAAWAEIQAQTTALIAALNKYDVLRTAATVTID